MNSPDEIPKLRLAPRESLEDMIHREERLRRAAHLQRESDLENSLAPFRVGSVAYLNAVPLTRGLEDQVVFATPARLAEMLRRDELDAALVSLSEVLFHDAYDVLDGIAIACLGEVKSVLVAHRGPLEEAAEIFCDPASLSSVNLLRVLLAERGRHPKLSVLPEGVPPAELPAVLLIGDRAIEFDRAPHDHQITDLGYAWQEMTRLPFVFAVWALKKGTANARLRRQLREARDFGMDTLDYIIASRPEFDLNFRRDYFTWHIHYHLGADEKRGVARFVELLRRHGSQPVFDPHYVE